MKYQLVSKRRGTIHNKFYKVDEIIIHIGSNDISKRVKQNRVIDNIDMNCFEAQGNQSKYQDSCFFKISSKV